jgi:hypothetical protein
MVVNIVDVGWATSKSGCLPISGSTNVLVRRNFQSFYTVHFSQTCKACSTLLIRRILPITVSMLYRNETEIYSFQDGSRTKKLFCGSGAGGAVRKIASWSWRSRNKLNKLPPGAEVVIKNDPAPAPGSLLFYQRLEEIL